MLLADDLQALIAYCQQLPSVDNSLPTHKLGPVLTLLDFLGKMPLVPVELIDHHRPMIARVDTAEGVTQGKYLAVSCSGCHQPSLKGGESAVPGGPAILDLTSKGAAGRWS